MTSLDGAGCLRFSFPLPASYVLCSMSLLPSVIAWVSWIMLLSLSCSFNKIHTPMKLAYTASVWEMVIVVGGGFFADSLRWGSLLGHLSCSRSLFSSNALLSLLSISLINTDGLNYYCYFRRWVFPKVLSFSVIELFNQVVGLHFII